MHSDRHSAPDAPDSPHSKPQLPPKHAEARPSPAVDEAVRALVRAAAADTWTPERYAVEMLQGAAALRAHEVEWQELADAASEPNPFFEPWFALAALQHLPQDVVAVAVWGLGGEGTTARRRLDGLFCFERPRVAPGLAYLRTWRHPYAYLGPPLIRVATEAEVWDAFLRWLPSCGRLPVVRLDLVPADGPLHRALVHALWERRWPLLLADASTRAFFRPAASAEAFLNASVRPKKRRDLRRQLTRLGEEGRLEFSELEEGEDVARWTDEFLALEAAGWKGRSGVAVAHQLDEVRFFRQMVRQARLRNRLRMLALRLDGRPIAMNLNLFSGGAGFAVKTTYDESLARYSPGVQLELENIQRLHQRTNVRWMDSCAAPDRMMMNQLWRDRRELHSLVFSADAPLASAVVAALPAVRWAKRWLWPRRLSSAAVAPADGR